MTVQEAADMNSIGHAFENGVLTLVMPEKLTLDAIQAVTGEKDRLLARRDYVSVVCDVSGIKLLDSSGISFFLMLYNALKKEGKDLFLYKPTAQTLNLLTIVRLRDLFNILPDAASMEALVKSAGK